jgi:hypothetical protein
MTIALIVAAIALVVASVAAHTTPFAHFSSWL